MGLKEDIGLGNVNIDFSGIVSGLGTFAQFVIFALIAGVIFGVWYYFRHQKKIYNINIPIFEEVGGEFQHRPNLDDSAMEFVIPGTSVRVFHLKKHNIYLPRGTIMMADNEYWYGIRKNREWVNFRIKNLNKDMKEANLDYDHTDMRYANSRLKKLLEANYKKKEKWWQLYSKEISLAVLILLLTFSFWFLIGKVSDTMSAVTPALEAADATLKAAEKVLGAVDNIQSGSGIVTAPG
jgi:hypothetical protein